MNSIVKKSVFVVEDSKEIRDLIRMLYESEGYLVNFAGNGKEALDKLHAMDELPGLILLDLMMPVMDGVQFRTEQEKDPQLSSIPVYIMTADSHVEAKSVKMNVAGSLKKPVSVDALLEVAERFCAV